MAYRVLIVDDSGVVRKSLTKTLQLSGIELVSIAEAANGKEALEYIAHTTVDVIFLDINMPVMTGIDFLREKREKNLCTEAAVIVVSTEGSAIRAQELKDLGVRVQLRKPVRPESLAETVREALGCEEGK